MISINYMLFSRPFLLELNSKIIKKISDKNKSKIRINFLATDHHLCQIDSTVMGYIDDISSSGIEVCFKVLPHDNNYLEKIKFGISNAEYFVKWDEDCFISHHIWNYLIENIEVLDESLFLTTPLSTGIPSTDVFVKDIFTTDEYNVVNEMFRSTAMPKFLWGFDYSSLNECTIYSGEWNYSKFYEKLERLNYYYSGIHPVRINYQVQSYINETCFKHLDKIFGHSSFTLDEMKALYFCNSFYAIKSERLNQILNTPSLFVDAFDEVALNRFWKISNLKGHYIRGSGGIHFFYNTVNHFGYDFIKECRSTFNRMKEIINEY